MKHLSNAISSEYADNIIEELILLEPDDLTQLRRSITKLEPEELSALKVQINKLLKYVHNITYERKKVSNTRQNKDYQAKKIKQLKEAGELD